MNSDRKRDFFDEDDDREDSRDYGSGKSRSIRRRPSPDYEEQVEKKKRSNKERQRRKARREKSSRGGDMNE